MTKSTVNDVVDTMFHTRRAGFVGPLVMNLKHPLFNMASSWARDGLMFLSGGEPGAESKSTNGDAPIALVRDPRNTTSITNQHSAMIVDRFVTVTTFVSSESHDEYYGIITNEDYVCADGVSAVLTTDSSFTLKASEEFSTGDFVIKAKNKTQDFSYGDSAFADHTSNVTKKLSESPVRIALRKSSSDDRIGISVRVRASDEPFFYALSKTETRKLHEAVASKSRTKLLRMFKIAVNETSDILREVHQWQKTADGSTRPEVSSKEGFESLFDFGMSLHPSYSLMFSSSDIESGKPFSLLELIMNFTFTGVSTLDPGALASSENAHVVPIVANWRI